jgi:hypothetical protein
MRIPTENVHWLFGTSLQIIATFVGLLAAGFFFFHDRLENERDRDETLSEIYDEIKKQYYRRFKTLFVITAFSIILGFWVLYAAAAGIEWHNNLVEAVIAMLHMFNLALAGLFFIFMVDPDIIQHTARRLAKKNTKLFNDAEGKGMSPGEFIGKFSALDKMLRLVASRDSLPGSRQAPISFVEMISDLHEKGVISDEQFRELQQISMARNISRHSKGENIETSLGTTADKLNKELKIINEKAEAAEDI